MPGYRLSSGVYSHEGMTAARTRISEEMSKTVFRVGTESRSDARDGDNWPTEAWHREDIIQPYRLTGSLCGRSAAFCAEGAAATHSSNKGGKLSRRVMNPAALRSFSKNSASSSSSPGIRSRLSDMALLPARSANSRYHPECVYEPLDGVPEILVAADF